jgi:hypothetical protein
MRKLSNAIKYAIPARVRWWLYCRLMDLSCWLRDLSSWLIIDNRPPTSEEIAHGQELWAEIQAKEKAPPK